VSYKIYRSSNAYANRRSSEPKKGEKDSSTKHKHEGGYCVISGLKIIAYLPYLENSEVETLPVTISTSQLDGNRYYTDGGKSKKRDKLEGIWIKLFHGGEEVGEFKSSGSALKTAVWK